MARAEDFLDASDAASFLDAATPGTPIPAQVMPPAGTQRGLGQEFLRQLGLTARHGITGATGLGQMLADVPVQLANVAGARLPLPSQAQQQLMTRLGLPQPETPLEKGVGIATTMAAGVGDPVSRALQIATTAKVPEAFRGIGPRAENREILRTMQDRGFVVPPTQAKAGPVSRTLEGLGGSQRVTAMAQERTQAATDNLVRRVLRLSPDAPLNYETTHNIAMDAYERGYEPIKQAGVMVTGPKFQDNLTAAFNKFHGANTSFPEAVEPDVANLIESYRKTKFFNSEDALDAIRQLRAGATAARRMNPPNSALANARLAVSNALETEIDRNLAGAKAGDLLQNYRDARKLIAMTDTVDDILVEGTGSVNALKLAAKLKPAHKGGVPLSGELLDLAKFAKAFPRAAGRPTSGMPAPFSMPEQYMLGAGGLGSMITPGLGVLGAIPPTRLAFRHLVTNPAFQRAFVQPSTPAGPMNPALVRALPATYQSLFGEK